MNFSELEKLMSSRGVVTLAEIARTLNTTPQAVSNWKARNQVPHRIAAKLSQLPPTGNPQTSDGPPIHSSRITHYASPSIYDEDTISLSLSDIFITFAEQLKVIILVPFVSVFLVFTYVQFIKQPLYISSATILLPENKPSLSGLAGLASQFGVAVPQGADMDLSSPSLFPELVKSRMFSERMMEKSFYTERYEKELPLISILTYGESISSDKDEIKILSKAISIFQNMVSFRNEGSFSIMSVESDDPKFARDVNNEVLAELQSLNYFFKSRNVNDKINFIENRIRAVEGDLTKSEQNLKSFLENNRQIISPALQLEQERFNREVDIQKNIYLTLKQQLELAKIEEIQEASVVQVLDKPQIPLDPYNKNIVLSVLLAGVLGILLGVLFSFIRAYSNNADGKERKKLRRAKYLLKKKGKDILKDYRVSGIVGLILLFGLPFFLGHESQNPVFFGIYSVKLLVVNTVYVLTLLLSLCLFIYLIRNKKINS